MRILVVVSAVLAAVVAAPDSCGPVHHYYSQRNVTPEPIHHAEGGGAVCGGACCAAGMEAALGMRVRRELAQHAEQAARATQRLLASAATTLHEHVAEVSKQSKNKTQVMFAQVYRGVAARAHAAIELLYGDVQDYLRADHQEMGAPPLVDIDKATHNFFTEIFPIAYHKTVKLERQDFSDKYKQCLKGAYTIIQPFGEIPKKVASSLSKSLEATRVLLQALALGSEVLEGVEDIVGRPGSEVCEAALLRMAECGRCRGHVHVKPCPELCLNVIRGCVTGGGGVGALEAPWSSYVDGVERLVRADAARTDAAKALKELHSQISEAIMHAIETSNLLERKVKRECGSHEAYDWAGGDDFEVAATSRPEPYRVSPPDTELLQFAAALAQSRRLFADLADTLCRDDTLVETNPAVPCWTGDQVGQYTNMVAEASTSMQKYNPEISPESAPEDPKVAALADRLRHARQVLVREVSAAAQESFMLGDEAEGEGESSGSGQERYGDDEGLYDAEGSGEGSGHIETSDTSSESKPEEPVVKKANSATLRTASFSLLILLVTLSRNIT